MKVSVIIPVYCVEQYITDCVNSVLAQNYTDVEVILVDDGSPDNCGKICDALAAGDKRCKVIHKANGGLSDARNAGVAVSTGDFLMFLDGDDYWDDTLALSKLCARIQESDADILQFSYKKVYEDSKKCMPYFCAPDMPLGLALPAQLEYLEKHGVFIASACNKMIRRSLLADIRFENGVYSEDITWCMDVTAKAASVDYICESFYCYRQRSRSITHTPSNKRCGDLAKAILACVARLEAAEEPFNRLFRVYTAFQYGTFILVQAQTGEYQKQWIDRLAQYKWILRYHGSSRKLLCLWLGSLILGYKGLCSLVRLAYGFKR